MATKIEVINQADKIVSAQLAKRRLPAFDTLKGAWDTLGDLASVSKSLTPQAEALPSEFAVSLETVIKSLATFRAGYTSTHPTVHAVTKRASLTEFIDYVKAEIEKAAAEPDEQALPRLQSVSEVIRAAIAEIDRSKDGEMQKAGGVLIPVTNDPDKVIPTETSAAGAKVASGTSSPSTAASNFATNPGDINTSASAPAASTSAATSAAGKGTGGDAGSAFAGTEPVFPAGGGSGPAASTSAVTSVASGATNTGDVDVTKAAKEKEDAELAKASDELRKAAEKQRPGRKRDGWSHDLNSKEFLLGQRTVDFGADRTPATR